MRQCNRSMRGEFMNQQTHYSTFSDRTWQVFKKVAPDKDENTFLEWWRYLMKKVNGDKKILYAQIACLFLWKYRKLEHYFLSEGLADFLASSVKDFTLDFCRKLPCSVREPSIAAQEYSAGVMQKPFDETNVFRILEKDKPIAFALHFPVQEKRRSIVVWPDACMIDRSINAVHAWFFAASDSEDICVMQIGSGDMGDASWMCRVIFGFSLYIEAFPEVVADCQHGDIPHINYYKGSGKTVCCNEIVAQENEGAAASPHFRRGHFRVLQSERYTKKRGQIVFVKGCFVRGQAFEVLSDAA
jgi:hypothetical protein